MEQTAVVSSLAVFVISMLLLAPLLLHNFGALWFGLEIWFRRSFGLCIVLVVVVEANS